MFKRETYGIEQCEAAVLRSFLIASILGSIVTIVFFVVKESNIYGIMGHIFNILLSVGIINAYRMSKKKYGVIIFFELYYFFFLFLGVWMVLSFRHTIVVFYSVVVLISNILLLKKKELGKFLLVELIIILLMISYDVFIRVPDQFYQATSIGQLIGSAIVFFNICYVVYIYKGFVQQTIEELSEYSFVDPLTKAKNSRALADDMFIAMNHWHREQLVFSVINIDINEFKGINDTYGHQMGDDVLRELVDRFQSIIREGESIYRNGGDEFVILLLGSSHDAAEMFVRRIDECHDVSTDFDISFSYGIADIAESLFLKKDILTLADERMYQSKQKKETSINCNKGTFIFKASSI